jgi:hypothetical protein
MASKKDKPREKFNESVLRTDERIDLLETIHEMVEKEVEEVIERKFNSKEVQHMFNQLNKRP